MPRRFSYDFGSDHCLNSCCCINCVSWVSSFTFSPTRGEELGFGRGPISVLDDRARICRGVGQRNFGLALPSDVGGPTTTALDHTRNLDGARLPSSP